ncbi:hypothetical protein [Streptomyces virginiae]|uniref:hypothetical protein n=1 Tax=Streptomyces virginiae TaxID=1961 RepID=UPI00225642ED|nr:hypothetical protein [Streptomyces virginiae]MCX5174467.1 hypothetical protein [Streptomyces virginiae]
MNPRPSALIAATLCALALTACTAPTADPAAAPAATSAAAPSPAPTLDPYAAGHAHGQQRRADYPDYVPTGDVLKDVKQSGMWNMSRAMKIAVHCGEWSAKSAPDSTASTNPLGGPSAESPQDAWRRGCVDGANDDPPTPVKS